MMGDDMAIRSGGMYGNPESKYTIAKPITNSGSFGGGVSLIGNFMETGLNIASSFGSYWAKSNQISRDLATLHKEKEYNISNFQQHIADVLAKNKMSFYSSGLDIKSGTAQDVMISNRKALEEDLGMMIYNYDMKEMSLKAKKKAARGNLVGNVTSSVLSAF